jgi:hypothetical protein
MNITPNGSSQTIPFAPDQPAAAKRSKLFYAGLAGLISGGICCLLSAVALILYAVQVNKAAPEAGRVPVKSPTGTALPATSTSLPASTPTNTSLPASTETPTLQSTSGNAGVFTDDFSNTNGGWYEGSTDNYDAGYFQGSYTLGVKKAKYFFVSLLPNPFPQPIQNIIISVNAKTAPGGPAEVGVVCGYQDIDNFYLSAVRGDQFYIGKMVGGVWTYLTSPDMQPLIAFTPAQDGYLTIGMSCINSFIVLEVNGVGQAHVTDDTFSKGDIGLYVWGGDQMAQTGYYARGYFDNFSAKLPQQ